MSIDRPLATRIEACIVNHNTSEFAELALRSLAAMSRELVAPRKLRITVMDNHSTDVGLPDLVAACTEIGAEFEKSAWPLERATVNSHGDVLRDFVADHRSATHYLFVDADTYVLTKGTVERMSAELEADPRAWAIQARFEWAESSGGTGSSLNPWSGRTQQLRATIDGAVAGPFTGEHKIRCHPAFALVINTEEFRRVADVMGLSSAVIIAANQETAGFADTFGLATLAMSTHDRHHILSDVTVGHYYGVSYSDPHQPLGNKSDDCRRRLARLRAG